MSEYKASITLTKNQPAKNSKGQPARLRLDNVMLMYVRHTGFGALKYGAKPVEGAPHMNHQYECDVLITKPILKELQKYHKKQSAKEYTREQFVKNFKVEPPFEDPNDEYYVTKFYREAFFKSGENKGEEAPRVPVVDNAKPANSLEEVAVGNGSMGSVIVNKTDWKNDDFGSGTSMRLGAIKVTDLVEYTASTSDVDEFDDEDEEEVTEESSGSDWDE